VEELLVVAALDHCPIRGLVAGDRPREIAVLLVLREPVAELRLTREEVVPLAVDLLDESPRNWVIFEHDEPSLVETLHELRRRCRRPEVDHTDIHDAIVSRARRLRADHGSVGLIPGGRPVVGPGADSFGDEERAQVLDVLAGGHLSRFGDLDDPRFKHKVYDLEREFATFCGSSYAVATNSGTTALLASLHALGIGEGDEVLVPGFTYVATYAAIVHARAVPVLVEIDESLTIDPNDLERKVTDKTKAVVAVHMLGNPCDMDAVQAVADQHGLQVIEDACQAAGASFRGRRVGSFGALAAFSFNRYKLMSAGEGGMVTTSDLAMYERTFAVHDQGHTPLRSGKTQTDRSLIGLNFKMNELTGAVALAQLRKLEGILDALHERKALLRSLIDDVKGVNPRRLNDAEGECATFLTSIFDDPAHAASTAAALGVAPLSETGWHNYRHMDHVRDHRTHRPGWSSQSRFAQPGDLPRTDDLLSRSVNVAVGVTDSGLGSGFGLTVRSTAAEVAHVARRFSEAIRSGG
jgi:dTDP-4-amino-4,6-dideoxygalactose transaminase